MEKYKVILLPAAKRAVDNIATYIVEEYDNETAAKAFLIGFYEALNSLSNLPYRCKIREDVKLFLGYRQLIYRDYKIIFRITGDEVVIVTVMNASIDI